MLKIGVPALSLPICLSKEGLPISLQVIAPKYSEEKMFQLCNWIESYFDFKKNYKMISY